MTMKNTQHKGHIGRFCVALNDLLIAVVPRFTTMDKQLTPKLSVKSIEKFCDVRWPIICMTSDFNVEIKQHLTTTAN